MKSTTIFFVILVLVTITPSSIYTNNFGVPLGILIDKEFHKEVEPIIKSTLSYLNNQIKYGRNKWFFYLDVLFNLENHAIIKSVCNQMNHGVLAVFSHVETASYEALKSFTSFYEMPFITMTHPVHEYNYMSKTGDETNDGSGGDQQSMPAAIAHTQPHLQPQNNFEYKSTDSRGGGDGIRSNNDKPYESFVLNMHPNLVPVLVSMIKYNRWKTIYYVYDHEEAMNRLEGLFEFQIKDTDFHTNILVRKLDALSNARKVLKPISIIKEKEDRLPLDPYRRNVKNEITIFLDMKNVASYYQFLEQAKFLGMNTSRYHYFLVTLSIQDLDLTPVRQGGAVITGFSMVDSKNLNTLTLLSDALQMNVPLNQLPKISYRASLFIDALIYFNKQIHQLVGKDMNRLFGLSNVSLRHSEIFIDNTKPINCSNSLSLSEQKWPLGRLIIENLKNMPSYEGLTGPISFDSNGQRTNYTIYIYRMAMNIPLTRIGFYSNQNGLKIIEEAIFRDNTLASINRNRKRYVVSILDEPFFMEKPNADPTKNLTGNDRFMGYCVDLAEHIAKIVNFTYEFRVVGDNKFGAQLPNGEWNGIIGELVRHVADLAIAPLTISLVRERAVEFSKPFMNLGISIMVYKPIQESPKVFSFMAPLSKEIWMCVTLAYVGISVILFLVSRFSPYEWKLESIMGQRRLLNEFSIYNTLWFCLAAFMQQGVVIAPKSISGRLTTSVWWFFTLILISSYTANLAAFLTVERMVSPIESAEDLSKQNEIQYGVVEGGSTMAFFRTNKNPIYQKMWAFMSGASSSVLVKNNFEGVQKVRDLKGKYAFLLESSINEYLNERKPCNTMKVGSNLDSKGYGIATPIGSDLKEAINLAVLQAKEDGTLEDLKRKWYIRRSECGGNQKSLSLSKDASRNTLGIANIAGIFYILIIGLVISVIIAAFEILYKARIEARRSKMIFKEAVKSKVRLSITGYEDNKLSPEELETLKTAAYHTGKYGWTLEPPK